MSFTLFVQPQRQAPNGSWISCPEHRAKRWVVCSERTQVRNGKSYRIVTQHAKFPTKKAAYEDLLRRQRLDSASRFSPKPALGARWPKPANARPPLTVSLSEHQYLALQPKKEPNQ